MPNLPKGLIVAETTCAECGKPVRVKLNKNGNGYYYCPWTDPEGDPCRHHERYGKTSSQRMQREYLASRKQAKGTAHDAQAPDDTAPDRDDDAGPDRDAGPARDRGPGPGRDDGGVLAGYL